MAAVSSLPVKVASLVRAAKVDVALRLAEVVELVACWPRAQYVPLKVVSQRMKAFEV